MKITLRYVFIILLVALIQLLSGCSGNTGTDAGNTSQVVLDNIVANYNLPPEAFKDISLIITKDVRTDSSHIYTAQGLYKKDTVGIKIEVRSNIPPGLVTAGSGTQGFNYGAIRFSSLGRESNNFIKGLSELYNVPTSKPFTKDSITIAAVSLNKKIADLDKNDYYKFTIALRGGSNPAGELYFNINTSENVIELSELDPAYRQKIIDILTQ